MQALTAKIRPDGDSPDDNIQEQIKLVNVSIEMVTLVIKKFPHVPGNEIVYTELYDIFKERATSSNDNIEVMENSF